MLDQQTNETMQKRYQSLSELEKVNSKKNYQDSQSMRYQESIYLNDYQFRLYQAAIHGLSMYSPREQYRIPTQQKKKIIKFYTKTQRVLNIWKQQIINKMFEQLCSIQLNKFPQNPFHTNFKGTAVRNIDRFTELVDDTFECNLTFDQLKITREMVINKLIQEKIFPTNYYSLTKNI